MDNGERLTTIQTAERMAGAASAFLGALTEEQRKRLGEIADRCPIHRTLTSEIHIHTRVTTPSV